MDDRVNPLIRQYQNTLDSILANHQHLSPCISHCTHCGIRFLTHPRNAGRCGLRCPFGCRQHHRRQQSSQRSTAYYQTASGRRKKKHLNARRTIGERVTPPKTAAAPLPPPAPALPEEMRLVLDGITLTAADVKTSSLLDHLRMVIRLIEGKKVSRGQLIASLLLAMRQHSIAYRTRTDYVLRFLHQHPP